jgi:YVTN family beta-propeller protein
MKTRLRLLPLLALACLALALPPGVLPPALGGWPSDPAPARAQTLVTTIPLPGIVEPYAVAANPVTNRIYVTNRFSHSLSVIAGDTNTVLATLDLPGAGFLEAVLVNPSTNRVYVSDFTNGTVIVLDAQTNRVITTITLQPTGSPSGLALNPSTNRLYVANRLTGPSVSVIDVGTDTFLHNISLPNALHPLAVAVDPGRNRVYAVGGRDTLSIIDAQTDTLITNKSLAGADTPFSVAVNTANGRVYVGNAWSHDAWVLDGQSYTLMGRTAFTGSFGGAVGIVVLFDPTSGRGFAAYDNDVPVNAVSVIDGGPGMTVTAPSGGNVTGAAINPATGRVYFVDRLKENMGVVDTQPLTYNTTLRFPTARSAAGAAADPMLHRLYVANRLTENVSVVDTEQNAFISYLPLPLGSAPNAIAVNPNNSHVYVAGNTHVSVVDGRANNFIGDIPGATGISLNSIAVNPITNRVYAANVDQANRKANLLVIDGRSDAFVKSIDLPYGGPPFVGVNRVTNRVYVASGTGNVSVIDGATDTYVKEIAEPRPEFVSGTTGIAINPILGRIYVSHSPRCGKAGCTPSSLSVIDAASETHLSPVLFDGSLSEVALNENTAHVFVSTGQIVVLDGQTNAVVTSFSVPLSGRMAVDSASSRLYLGAEAQRGVAVYDVSAVVPATPTPSPSPTATPIPTQCSPRPAVGVVVVPNGAGSLQATVSANTNPGVPPNSLVSLRFGPATGALIDVPGQPAGQTGSFTVTLPPGTTSTSFVVRQAAPVQAATVPLTVTDLCGDWPTVVGGGPQAFPPGSSGAPAPAPTATATPTPQRTGAPSGSSGSASSPAPVACSPRPPVQVTTAPSSAGQLHVTVAATGAGNSLQGLRFGTATNARIDAGAQTGSGSFSVTLPPGTTQTTFTVTRLTAVQPVTANLVAVDACGDWPTVVGAGASPP